MEELVKLVSDKVGISEAQAQQAVEVVLGFLRKNLPEPIAGQLDAVTKGELGDLGSGLGKLFG